MNQKVMQIGMKMLQNGNIGKIKNAIIYGSYAVIALIVILFGLIMYFEPWGSIGVKEAIVLLFLAGLLFARKIIMTKLKPIFSMIEAMNGLMGKNGLGNLGGLGGLGGLEGLGDLSSLMGNMGKMQDRPKI